MNRLTIPELCIGAALSALAALHAPAQAPPAAPAAADPRPDEPLDAVTWRQHRRGEELAGILKRLAAARPEIVRLLPLAAPDPASDREPPMIVEIGRPGASPAIWVQGHLEGDDAAGAQIAASLAVWLGTAFGLDPRVTALLDGRRVLILPTWDPAALDRTLAAAAPVPGGIRPWDDDGDGVADEDPAEDLDGDGRVAWMRRPDPAGRWKPGSDPRLLLPCAPDDPPGGWETLGPEGIDNDGDGVEGEDGPGGINLRLNFPLLPGPPPQSQISNLKSQIPAAAWPLPRIRPPARDARGPYPLSERGSRGVADALLGRGDIDLVLLTTSAGSFPAASSPPLYTAPDLSSLDAVRSPASLSIPDGEPGSLEAWVVRGLGAWALRLPYAGAPSAVSAAETADLLAWTEREFPAGGFAPWRPFLHPALGRIEVGGWTRAVGPEPDGRFLEEACRKAAQSFLEIAAWPAAARVSSLSIRPVGASKEPVEARATAEGDAVVIRPEKGGAARRTVVVRVEAQIAVEGRLPPSPGGGRGARATLSCDRPLRFLGDPGSAPVPFDLPDNSRTARLTWLVELDAAAPDAALTLTIDAGRAGTVKTVRKLAFR